jgi:hypothetical protein
MDIYELLKDHKGGMTEFQHDRFVTGMAGTPYGQYRQALRELNSRFDGLRDGYCELESLQVDIDEQQYIIDNSDNEFDRRRAEITYKQKMFLLESRKRAITEKEDDALSFYRQAVQLKEQVGDINSDNQEQFNEEYWEHKIKKMAALDLMTNGRLSRSTIETSLALKGDLRKRVLESFDNPDDLVEEIQHQTEKQTHLINGKKMPMLDFKTLVLE